MEASKGSRVIFCSRIHLGPLTVSLCSDDDDAGSLDILMEAPEGFRNSDEECFSESQVT